MSLRLKYMFYSGIVVALVLALFSVSVYRAERSHLRDALRGRVKILTDYVRASLVSHMLEDRAADFQGFLETLVIKDMEEIRVFSTDGKILASSIQKEVGLHIYPQDFEAFNRNEKPRVFEHKKYGRELFSMVVPLYNEKTCQRCHDPDQKIIGVLDTEVAVGEELAAPLRDLRLLLSAGYFVSILLILTALGVITGRLVNHPVQAIISTMRRAQAGDLSVRYRTPRIDEIGRLATNLNLMLASVESAAKEIERYHEERLQRVERLATVGELATTIAHEIKNPLAGISGAIQVLSEEIGDDPEKNAVIDEIHHQIGRLDKSIRDLQNFAKPPDPSFIRVDVNAVLERTLAETHRVVASAALELALVPDPEAGEVELDPDMIQEAVFNVVSYCIHSTPNCESISVSSRRQDANSVAIIITSSKCSVVPDLREDVFRPAFSTREESDGLGLAISKGIVEKHGGGIRLDRGRGEGVSFVITLPVVQKEEHARA